MINNDILRRLRFILDFNDSKMQAIFMHVQRKVPDAELLSWLKQESTEGFASCNDLSLCQFLDGLVIEMRGLKEGAEPIVSSPKLSNNLIFKKLRIAFNLHENDILEAFDLAGFPSTKSEVGALFRKPEHKNYRECSDQILRYFIKGLSLKVRGK